MMLSVEDKSEVRLIVREEIVGLATKTDLAGLATKAELAKLAAKLATKSEVAKLAVQFEEFRHNFEGVAENINTIAKGRKETDRVVERVEKLEVQMAAVKTELRERR